MPEASVTHISDLDPTTYGPSSTGANGDIGDGWEFIYDLRVALSNDLANIAGAVTASHTELNYCDITTLGTAENSKFVSVDGSGNADCSAVTFTDLGTVTTVDINGGSIDGAAIGANSASTVACTTLSASGNATVGGTLSVTGNVTVGGGTLDDTPVGGTTPAAGTFTTLVANTSLVVNGSSAMTAILDEDAMGTDSATALATQQSIKAYVDARVATQVIPFEIADVSTAETIYVPIPVTGTVTRFDTCLQGAISVADATVTMVQSDDSAMASVTVAYSGSAAGDVDSDTSITNASVTAGDYLKISTDGGSTTAVKLLGTITVTSAVA